MSSQSRRPRSSQSAPQQSAPQQSNPSMGMGNSQAMMEPEAAQNPFQAIGNFFNNLFGGGQQTSQATGTANASNQQASAGASQGQQAARVRTGLGADVDQAILASYSLANRVQQILADGWTLRYTQQGDRQGSYCNRQAKTIVINKNHKGSTRTVVGTLAHEVGHATTPIKAASRRDPNFVNKMVHEHLRNEAEATIFNIECAEETDSGVFDREDFNVRCPPGCRELYNKFKRGEMSREDMVNRMADIIGRATPSTDPSVNYYEYYARAYRQ